MAVLGRFTLIAKHGIDPDKILLSGFSIGGSMTSYLACAAPDSFPAYAPIGGSFWRPHPTGCEGDVRLLHTHGWSDGTVPLEGRLLRGTDINDVGALAQGDVFHAMEIWRAANDCVHLKADRFDTSGPFWRRAWDRCLPGSALELALFPGGHVIPKGWAKMALDWFENL
jgi:polyhydroxybutyrate depolymerase